MFSCHPSARPEGRATRHQQRVATSNVRTYLCRWSCCVPARAGSITAGTPAHVIILGLILLILGIVISSGILWTIGIVLIVVGAVLWVLGSMDRAVMGRRHFW